MKASIILRISELVGDPLLLLSNASFALLYPAGRKNILCCILLQVAKWWKKWNIKFVTVLAKAARCRKVFFKKHICQWWERWHRRTCHYSCFSTQKNTCPRGTKNLFRLCCPLDRCKTYCFVQQGSKNNIAKCSEWQMRQYMLLSWEQCWTRLARPLVLLDDNAAHWQKSIWKAFILILWWARSWSGKFSALTNIDFRFFVGLLQLLNLKTVRAFG